jgi:hypothetical protein
MPEFHRDKSGAVVIKYNEKELDDHLGYRLLRLEKRVEELERILREVLGILRCFKEGGKGVGDG